MTADAARWAWKRGITDRKSEAVLVTVARFADGTGLADVRVRTLAEICDLTEKSVKLHLDALAAKGYLTIEARGSSKVYRLNIEEES